jgi:Ca2+-binding EF-hand superfamily protein
MEQTTLTPLQVRKFSTLFAMYDVDGSGALTESDFREQARRIQQAFGLSAEDRRARSMLESRVDLFHRLASGADKDRDGSVSLPEFLRYFERQILVHRAAHVASPWLTQVCRDVIELIDQDGSQSLTVREYARLLQAMGSTADAEATFARLDRNQDGRLTLDELIALSLEFMMSDDPEAPGNFFYCGKL